MGYCIQYACAWHTGKVRRTNQDNFICGGKRLLSDGTGLLSPLTGSVPAGQQPLFGVFDGMGGEEQGEMASFLAAEAARLHRPGGNLTAGLEKLCLSANGAICAWAAENSVRSTGSTAALLLFDSRRVHLCNIGDSRIFRLRNSRLEQLSEDHLSPAPFGMKRPLYQSLGIPPEELRIEPYLAKFPLAPSDRFLLCSDGLTDMVDNDRIAAELSCGDSRETVMALMKLALEAGGKDNITVIVCSVEKAPLGLFQKPTQE